MLGRRSKVAAPKSYTVETNQPDTEVIQFQGNYVYYRVNQTIWRAELSLEGVVRPHLLVDDPIALDIHWAFLGPRKPI